VNYSNSQRAGVILYLAASLFGGYAGKRTRERGKEELPLKQIATVCTPSKGADRGHFFAFRLRCFQPWANFYSTVLLKTIENRAAIIGR
jgi:hypothetical protein